MSGIGESRSELLGWLNELLRLNYAKIEQCGTGAAYCQIVDSVYRDVPMHRVKFNATAEYEFLTNFKILQSAFTKHRLEKTILVERLVKCRFQDNLEFLQWLKKFWVQNKDESVYDAESRRKYRAPVHPGGYGNGSQSGPSSDNTGVTHGGSASAPTSVVKKRVNGTLRSSLSTSNTRSVAGLASRKSSSEQQVLSLQAKLSQAQGSLETTQKEVEQYREAIAIMERERDFYFGKLRDIEILSQSTKDLCKEGVYSSDPNELVRFLDKIQQILYATEEGFEVAADVINTNTKGSGSPSLNANNVAPSAMTDSWSQPAHNLITDEETF
ncbi:LAME_0F09076g1_1 [Lachancea meyersii CBS 8951]|uniref:LAME_0F09076g1_1 n=1 Tax=Lachancea meyersii CBS 8951 TaxID=1266667 RepID=A0A1G4JUV5_9SACH|nr:LAME_0F09076g1_1 [Lachancea meyersii CBS 8951]